MHPLAAPDRAVLASKLGLGSDQGGTTVAEHEKFYSKFLYDVFGRNTVPPSEWSLFAEFERLFPATVREEEVSALFRVLRKHIVDEPSGLFRNGPVTTDSEGFGQGFLAADSIQALDDLGGCLLYTSPSPRDQRGSRMPSSA